MDLYTLPQLVFDCPALRASLISRQHLQAQGHESSLVWAVLISQSRLCCCCVPDVGSRLSPTLCAVTAQSVCTAQRCNMRCWDQANNRQPSQCVWNSHRLHLLDEPVPIECWHYAGHLQPCILAVAPLTGWHRDTVLQKRDTAGLLRLAST